LPHRVLALGHSHLRPDTGRLPLEVLVKTLVKVRLVLGIGRDSAIQNVLARSLRASTIVLLAVIVRALRKTLELLLLELRHRQAARGVYSYLNMSHVFTRHGFVHGRVVHHFNFAVGAVTLVSGRADELGVEPRVVQLLVRAQFMAVH